MAIHHVILPATLITLIFMHPLPVAIAKTINEFAGKDTISVNPFLCSTSMLHVIAPLTFVNGPHRVRISPLAMRHRHLEVAYVLVSQAVDEDPVSAGVAQVPISDIASTVGPVHAPLPISKASKPIAYVDSPILVSILSILILHAAQTMGL